MMTEIYAGGSAAPVFGFASNQIPVTSNAKLRRPPRRFARRFEAELR